MLTIGRSNDNDIMLNRCLQVSRKHCIFKYINQSWFVEDLSTNGILINTIRVGKSGRALLKEGDRLELVPGGILSFKFRYVFDSVVGVHNPATTSSTRVVTLPIPPSLIPAPANLPPNPPAASPARTAAAVGIRNNGSPSSRTAAANAAISLRAAAEGDNSDSEASESLLSIRSTTSESESESGESTSLMAPKPTTRSKPTAGPSKQTKNPEPRSGPSSAVTTSAVNTRSSVAGSSKTNAKATVASTSTTAAAAKAKPKRKHPLLVGKTKGKSGPSDPKRFKQLRSELLADVSSSSSSEAEELFDLTESEDEKTKPLAKMIRNQTAAPAASKRGATEGSGTTTVNLKMTELVNAKIILSPVDAVSSTSSGSRGMGHASSTSVGSKRTPTKPVTSGSTTSSDVENSTDISVLRQQIKYFMEQSRQADAEKKRLILEFKLQTDGFEKQVNDFESRLEATKLEAATEREEVYRNFLQVMENELNCCICNEVFIQATVIDCGHTFCNFCISEWNKKKEECPVCRAKLTNRTKHVEMENVVVRLHGLMAEEIQVKRRTVLQEREREVRAMEQEEEEAARLVVLAMDQQAANVVPAGAARRGRPRGAGGRARGRARRGTN